MPAPTPSFDPRTVAALAVLVSGAPVDQVVVDGLVDPYRDLALKVGGDRNGRTAADVFGELVADLPDGPALLDAVLACDPTAPIPETTKPRFQLLTVAELRERPAPSWLIDGVLVGNTISALAGPAGSLKSFIALDQSLCIATGRAWQGHPVKQGCVVYVSAEGSAGLSKRIKAWEIANETTVPDSFRILAAAPQLLDGGDLLALLEVLEALPDPPCHVVIDTLARTMVGGDENSARDMGVVIAGIDAIRQKLGCHVQLLHHTGKANGSIRGSSALPGALDTILEVHRDDHVVTIANSKQKDHEEAAPTRLEARIVDVDDDGETSLVLESLTSNEKTAPSHSQIGLILLETFGEEGATHARWLKRCNEENISRATYFRAKKSLVDGGFVVREAPPDKKGDAVYKPTEKLSLTSLKPVSRSPLRLVKPASLTVSHPLRSKGDETGETETDILRRSKLFEPGGPGDVSDADLFGASSSSGA